MNKFLLSLSFIALFFSATSRDVVGVYRTYSDYVNNNLDTMDLYLSYSHPKQAVTLLFIRNNEEYKVKCKEIWGFKLGPRLFRVDTKTGQPACVLSTGNIIYYENGPSYMDGYKSKKAAIEFTFGYFAYVSKDLNSEMVPYDQKYPEAMDKYNAFKKANPKYEDVFKCIGKSEDYSKIRSCVRNYNAVKDEE